MTNIRAELAIRSVTRAADGRVRFAGYANHFGAPDSYNTRIDPKSMVLARYERNPLILFNHDVDKVVGKATKIEKRDDGVWVEGEVSNSDAPHVTYVRDLVLEGMLKGLSIRFGGPSIKEAKDSDHPGCMLLSDTELQEISIVSLPAQPDSLFSVRRAQLAFENVRSTNQARYAMEHVRGSKVAKYILDGVAKASAKGVEHDDIMERLRDKSGLEAGALSQALDGEVTPMPDTLIAAACEILGCESEKIKELNAQDVEDSKVETETPADVEPKPIRAEGDVQDCVAQKIPKLIEEGKSQDEAVAIAVKMCSDERGCAIDPTDQELEVYMGLARQATQEPGETTPVKSEMPNDNAMLQKLDSLVSLMGALINEVKGLKESMAIDVAPKSADNVEIEIEPQDDDEEEQPAPEDPEAERMIAEKFAELEVKARSMGLI